MVLMMAAFALLLLLFDAGSEEVCTGVESVVVKKTTTSEGFALSSSSSRAAREGHAGAKGQVGDAGGDNTGVDCHTAVVGLAWGDDGPVVQLFRRPWPIID